MRRIVQLTRRSEPVDEDTRNLRAKLPDELGEQFRAALVRPSETLCKVVDHGVVAERAENPCSAPNRVPDLSADRATGSSGRPGGLHEQYNGREQQADRAA